MIGRLRDFFSNLFSAQEEDVSIGIYGPPNAGKSTLSNQISLDLTGEEMSDVSEVPHETRAVEKKEKVAIEADGRSIDINLLDMPGITTNVDFKDFKEHGMEEDDAKGRAKEATKGIVEAVKYLDDVDACLVIFDSTKDPYTQVNVTIIGNLEAKDIPILVLANKIDKEEADPERVRDAFPQHPVLEVSAKEGENIDKLYEEIIGRLS
ncbi:GTP-binding protein [Nanohaloarchaea archaeon]|jgi:small GTP-binding protein|nr:GTP-binding protein [Nanohaloarchaea archaeon H12]MBY6293895.1 GTP-binding protein [Nanohaloarchaea archaeon H01]NMI76829.1 GTP-binding protein [Candidatus Nanohaloarchaea archaeon]NMI89195.1 GTP-binding protein [Candidatus Nanohaloarchaea archaeon]NMJ77074.1 GTP-binding protein [Candidatus Nanohaloarchaea archaeon]